jgi:hypothetical protein
MQDGTKWGIIGIVLLVVYFIVSVSITSFILNTQSIRIIVLAAGIFFALLTLYAGSMAYKNGSKLFGTIDVLIGLTLVVSMIVIILRILATTISNMPTF